MELQFRDPTEAELEATRRSQPTVDLAPYRDYLAHLPLNEWKLATIADSDPKATSRREKRRLTMAAGKKKIEYAPGTNANEFLVRVTNRERPTKSATTTGEPKRRGRPPKQVQP